MQHFRKCFRPTNRNMATSDGPVSFEQIKGAIGSLVLLWSPIEREHDVAIKKISGRSRKPHGIACSLNVWSELVTDAGECRGLQIRLCSKMVNLLQEALAIRNLVCHGLVGISGQIHHTDPEAHLATELDGKKRILTWSELQTMFAWMSKAPWMIRDLTAAAMSRDADWAEHTLVSWKDFPGQK